MKVFKRWLLFFAVVVSPMVCFSQNQKNMNKAIASKNGETISTAADQKIKVLELRNYLIRHERRDEFINLFEENFIEPQNALGGYILGQYRVEGAPDNFFWIRGFRDMTARLKYLNDFYFGSPVWKLHKAEANSMLLNNDNVYLLQPVDIKAVSYDRDRGFDTNWFGQNKGIAVVDFYVSNTKRDKLIEFIKNKYLSILTASKIENLSFWISETALNDFPGLPVFQDANLLVQITFYKNESEFQSKMKVVNAKMNEESKTEMADLVTLKNTLILYPTGKSFCARR